MSRPGFKLNYSVNPNSSKRLFYFNESPRFGGIMEIPYGYCHCGCGQKTLISTRTAKSHNWIKGEPKKFIKNHQPKGVNNASWKGGRTTTSNYPKLLMPDYIKADSKGYINEHIYLAEKALGKILPPQARVHHHNETQLVICQDRKYHKLIHIRMRAYCACGNSKWRKCRYCKKYDEVNNMSNIKGTESYYHKFCHANYERNRKLRKNNYGDK